MRGHAEACPANEGFPGAQCNCHKSPMRVLESLTPGGSEFVGDPEACAAAIRATRDAQFRVLRQYKMQRDELIEAISQFSAEVLAKTWETGAEVSWDYKEGFRACKDEVLRMMKEKLEKGGVKI